MLLLLLDGFSCRFAKSSRVASNQTFKIPSIVRNVDCTTIFSARWLNRSFSLFIFPFSFSLSPSHGFSIFLCIFFFFFLVHFLSLTHTHTHTGCSTICRLSYILHGIRINVQNNLSVLSDPPSCHCVNNNKNVSVHLSSRV